MTQIHTCDCSVRCVDAKDGQSQAYELEMHVDRMQRLIRQLPSRPPYHHDNRVTAATQTAGVRRSAGTQTQDEDTWPLTRGHLVDCSLWGHSCAVLYIIGHYYT